ncbi:hypothetical protein BC937DRAFT_89527, partial [Endogone sp. FLAS-F59071]
MFNHLRYLARQRQLSTSAARSYYRAITARSDPLPKRVALEEVDKTSVTAECERDLILEVMSTVPTQRELRHFLKRYIPFDPAQINVSPSRSHGRSKSPREVVDSLLRPTTCLISLTKVQGPFAPMHLISIASTLVQLQRLGLTPVVVLDNEGWEKLSGEANAQQLRMKMLQEALSLVEAIERVGGRTKPVLSGVFWGDDNKKGDATPDAVSSSDHDTTTDSTLAMHIRSSFDLVQPILRNDQIPVILPMAIYPGSFKRPISANSAITALCRSLSDPNPTLSEGATKDALLPVKLVVINNEGGIPNHEKPGTAHSLINLQEEHASITQVYLSTPEWHHTHPTALQNLDMAQACLALLPTTSSAVIAPYASLPTALISNLITDKPLYSSSLPTTRGGIDPARAIASVNTSRTTVIRHGMSIRYHDAVSTLDIEKLTLLLEVSFGKSLDASAFYERLERRLACAIVAGEYEGAVLVTEEPLWRGEKMNSCYYLDKFAIAPTSQGIGLTDILWKRMTDAYPNLMWRSRTDNGVNKWYGHNNH